MSHGRQNFVNNCCRITISLWMLILYGWKKILENITCGYGHHLWKYWIYHSWPAATRDKSNIFTCGDHNHKWYFPIFFASHILTNLSFCILSLSIAWYYLFPICILFPLQMTFVISLCFVWKPCKYINMLFLWTDSGHYLTSSL